MKLLERLRSPDEPSVQKFSIYIPDKDKHRGPVENVDDWIDAAMRVLTDINGGSTRLPPAAGTWKDKQGQILLDSTTVVYSYVLDPDVFEERFDEIAAFVHEFGKGARQEAVMIELVEGHRAYFVDEDDYR
jgi:hypothetical protein